MPLLADGVPLPCQRHRFRLPVNAIYLNCASRSPMLHEVERVGHHAVSQKAHPWKISDDGVQERVRALFAELLGVSLDTIALTQSTSYALSQVAHNLIRLGSVAPGEAVLVLQNQMSSNVYPWQRLCGETKARLVVVSAPADGLWTNAVAAAVQAEREALSRIAVLAVPHFLWTDGSGPLDLEFLGALCEESGAKKTVFVVDATQSLGVVPVDVRRCNIDFLACSVHKWLFGPYGLSFMYASEEWCTNPRTEPIVHDEHNRVGADGDKVLPFHPTLGYAEEWMVGARRFDSGGRPNPILLPMVEMALTQILAWGLANIEVSLSLLTARVAAGSRVLGLSVPAHFAPHFVGVGPGPQDAPGGKSPVDVEARERWADAASSHLEARNIYVSSRGGSLRVAPHVYNTFDDIDKFLEALGSFVRVRRPTASL